MPTTRIPVDESVVEGAELRAITHAGQSPAAEELPPLGTADRIALRLGLALILWSRRHATRARPADRAERTEQARLSRAADHAAQSRDVAFEHRHQAGPTW